MRLSSPAASHPPPCTSPSVFYLLDYHLLSPSICLVQLSARFLCIYVCLWLYTYNANCASLVLPYIYLILPPTHCLHSPPYTYYHADPSCPLPPPPTRPNHRLHTMHQSALEQSCSNCAALGKSASAGDPRLWVALGRRGCYLGQQPIAAHPRLYPLGMQHATLSSSHIQAKHRLEIWSNIISINGSEKKSIFHENSYQSKY